MRLLAAGFNAHGQLSPNAGPTISTFSEIARSLPGEPIDVCWAGWSDVVLRVGSRDPRYYWRGHQGELELRVLATQSSIGENDERDVPEPPSLHSFFGTHDGCRGAITSESKLFLFPEGSKLGEESMAMTCSATDFKCTHVAVNGVGRTVVAVLPHDKASPTSTTIWEFSSLDHFIAFARHPSNGPQRPYTSHTIPHAPLRALHAGQTFHLAHTASSLESWATDLRHASSLGRPTDELTPCTSPSPVTGFCSTNDDDADTAVAKVATSTNGHLAAALTRDGSVYIWGTNGRDDPLDAPAHRTTPNESANADADRRGLALFASAEADGWSPADGPLPVAIDALPDEHVVDVAVGAEHVVLLDRTRGVWVAGDDAEGQLGARFVGEDGRGEAKSRRRARSSSGRGRRFLSDFRRVDLGVDERQGAVRVRAVACGWYATFLLLEHVHEAAEVGA